MSDTNQQPPTPLLYQMGLVVGQSMAVAVGQVRQEANAQIEEAKAQLQADVNAQNDQIQQAVANQDLQLNKILALVYAGL